MNDDVVHGPTWTLLTWFIIQRSRQVDFWESPPRVSMIDPWERPILVSQVVSCRAKELCSSGAFVVLVDIVDVGVSLLRA
jgi:hypothetical protein